MLIYTYQSMTMIILLKTCFQSSSNQVCPRSLWLMVAIALSVAEGVVAVLVEVPGTAIGVSLHECVVAGGSPLVPLGEDTVAFVMYTHCVHLLIDFPSLTWKIRPAVTTRIARLHELNDVGIIGENDRTGRPSRPLHYQ